MSTKPNILRHKSSRKDYKNIYIPLPDVLAISDATCGRDSIASNRHTVAPPTPLLKPLVFPVSPSASTQQQCSVHAAQVLQLILTLDIYFLSCRQKGCFLSKNKSPSASLYHSLFYGNWPTLSEVRVSQNSIPLFRSCSVSQIISDVFPRTYYTFISWDVHSSKHSTLQRWQ